MSFTQRENLRFKSLARRSVLLGGAQALLLGALAGRMYYLQVIQAEKYKVLADENRINLRLLAPMRGRIVDRFGVPLAVNKQNYRVVLTPEQAGDITTTLDALGQIINLTESDRRRVLRDVKRKHAFVPVIVRANLSWDEVARVEVNVLELPGVSIDEGFLRQYPFGETASHIVGYVAVVSEKELTGDPLLELPDFRIGKNGVEKYYDMKLRGAAGTSQIEVNALGRVVRELSRQEAPAGQELVLTLDMGLQEFATQRCAVEQSAACVVMDAPTGDVLALASAPGYDPTAFSTGISAAMWRDLTTNPRNPLSNKAISGAYAPGSTFKPMVALAALEAGAATAQARVSCSGVYEFADVKFHCWKKGGHGSVDLRDAIKKSCDVYFYEMGKRLGIDKIAAMSKRFGLGQKLDFDVPGERPGLIPTREWKMGATGVPWQQGETISSSIGQSYVLATPLQLATMTARLATGRAIVPRILRERGIMAGPVDENDVPDFPLLQVKPADLKLVLEGMNAVCNEQGGTAYGARILEPQWAMAGKSGTSQVRRITQYEREHGMRKITEVPWKERDHALFISYAPVQAPRYVCAVVVEHGGETAGGGSAVAAPICRDVLREAQKRDPARRVPSLEYVASLDPPAGRDRKDGGG